jgi:hypothetical protein
VHHTDTSMYVAWETETRKSNELLRDNWGMMTKLHDVGPFVREESTVETLLIST